MANIWGLRTNDFLGRVALRNQQSSEGKEHPKGMTPSKTANRA